MTGNRDRRTRRIADDPRLVLLTILVASLVAYFPTLNAPFWLDDYIYLSASRDLGALHYTRLVFTPWSEDPAMPFTRDFWRPLSFLYFLVARPVFGGHVAPYHIVNLAIHLAAVALAWRVARKLDGRTTVAAVTALVVAFYPGSTDAISWVSSVNSAGLPVMLASWTFFIEGTRKRAPDWRWLWVAAGLLACGLMFRESSGTLLAPIALWYLLVQRRKELTKVRTYFALIPYIAVCCLYLLIRTRFFSEPAANPDIYGFGGHFDNHWWYYIKNALLPFRDPVTGWRVQAQQIAGAALLAAIPLALFLRRWGLLALLLGLVISVIPSAAAILGVGQRYFYFSTPVLALVLAIAVADAGDWLKRRRELPIAAAPVFGAITLILGVFVVWDRNQHWEDIGPVREQAWVAELRAEYPALPSGGTLYCVNIPLDLALFDAANLGPVVRWYYPEVGDVRWAPTLEGIPPLGPADRVFVADDGQLLGDTRPER